MCLNKAPGLDNIDKVINIDQSPIGRTPRSNPATYTALFGPIRELFSSVPEARSRGYKPGRFSFNVKGGRCENCEGAGYKEIQMQFLPDVSVPCEECKGNRYNKEALEIKFKGLSISDVLNLTVSEAMEVFSAYQSIFKKLSTLNDVGLGYLKLGQPATTLSGGEAQRVKLSTYLSKRATGKTLFILDEPTTGLSFEDCNSLIKILHRLVDNKNSVILIEHHLDIIKNADSKKPFPVSSPSWPTPHDSIMPMQPSGCCRLGGAEHHRHERRRCAQRRQRSPPLYSPASQSSRAFFFSRSARSLSRLSCLR